jgi:hypothetical protein
MSCRESVSLSENLTGDPDLVAVADVAPALAVGLKGMDMGFSYRKIYTTNIQYFTQR